MTMSTNTRASKGFKKLRLVSQTTGRTQLSKRDIFSLPFSFCKIYVLGLERMVESSSIHCIATNHQNCYSRFGPGKDCFPIFESVSSSLYITHHHHPAYPILMFLAIQKPKHSLHSSRPKAAQNRQPTSMAIIPTILS